MLQEISCYKMKIMDIEKHKINYAHVGEIAFEYGLYVHSTSQCKIIWLILYHDPICC